MPFGGGHALLIGVGSHTYAPHLDVPISVEDAKAVAEILTNEAYCGYPQNQVKVLHDRTATREGILGELAEMTGRVKSDDTVTIFYCGHGDYGTDGEYYLVGYDARISGSKVQAGTGVSQSALVERLANIPAKRVLVIFNACHSAEISPTLSVDQALGSKILPDTAKDALLSTGSGRIIITACKEEQLSYIGKGDLSIFTQAVVDGLLVAQVEGSVDVLQQGADHRLHASLQLTQLLDHILAAVDRQHLEAFQVTGVGLHRLRDLDRQLAGGADDQPLRIAAALFQVLQRHLNAGQALLFFLYGWRGDVFA